MSKFVAKRIIGFILIGLFILTIATLLIVKKSQQRQEFEWNIPAGFPSPNVPEDNPMTYAKIELGRALFFEPALSGNRAMSCSTCHQPEFAFAQNTPISSGSTGKPLKRNALALVNVAYNNNMTWAHPELNSIEAQMLLPLFSDTPPEMGTNTPLGTSKHVLNRFKTDDYHALFKNAYGDTEINYDRIVKAIASFVRSLTSFNSAFDDYAYRAKDEALDDKALRGMELFFSERLECFHCHGGFNFTQSSTHEFQPLDLRPFHNTGLYNVDGKGAYPQTDLGLIEITRNPKDMGRYRAPTLRNIAYSAPYMHDGSLNTLVDVINFYAAGGRGKGIDNPFKSQFIRGFVLTEQEHEELLAFLNSLSDESFINNPEHNAPISMPKTH